MVTLPEGPLFTVLALVVSAWAQEPEPPVPPSDAPVETAAPAEPAPAEPRPAAWQKVGWGWGAIPAINYNTDEGFGFGALGSLYRYDGKTAPYKSSYTLLLFMTTKAVHSHRFDMDLLDVGGSKLRLQARVMLDATRTANYCGYGWDVPCDPAVAEQAADDLGLEPGSDEREDFERRYYRVRWVRPYVHLIGRYRVYDGPPEIEVFAGWRGEYLFPGDFREPEPFPGSLYDTDIGAEKGFMSVLQVGANLDTRDNEPSPRRGHWHEVSIRGAAPFLGSAWSYFGFNTTLRFYAPLAPNGRLTLASRTVLDGIVGDAHVREMAGVGGLKYYSFGGGDMAGRGIRLRRYVGRVKAMEQLELRWVFVQPTIGKTRLEFTLLAFADVLVAAEEWSDIGPAFAHPRPGEGIGLRIAINESFVLRGDVGVSHVEGWSPGVYLDVDHLF